MVKQVGAVVLLSGGLDSVVALAQAVKQYHVLVAITFDYGQRAAKSELRAASKVAKHYGVNHQVIKLPWLADLGGSALTDRTLKVPLLSSVAQGNKQSAKAVWVPNRNGVFLNIAAAFAERVGAKYIITGFNAEEAATFPDNSLAFCQAADNALAFSTLNKVKVKNYFYNKSKVQIVKLALASQVPLSLVWSCYSGGRKPCGKCESCMRYNQAVKGATNAS